MSTSYTAAAYLASSGFDRTAFLIGNEGVAEELEAAGISYLTFEQICEGASSSSSRTGGGGDDGGQGGAGSNASSSSAAVFRDRWTPETLGALQLDAGIGAVVVGAWLAAAGWPAGRLAGWPAGHCGACLLRPCMQALASHPATSSSPA